LAPGEDMRLRLLSDEESAAADRQAQQLLRQGKEHLRDLGADEAKTLLRDLASSRTVERRAVRGVRFPDRLEVRLPGLRNVDFVECDLTNIRLKAPRFGKEFSLESCSFESCVWENPLFDHWMVTDTVFRKTRFTKVWKGWFVKVAFERCLFEDCVLPDSIKECVLRDVEFRARGGMETFFRDCLLERVSARARFMVGVDTCRCAPLDLREAQVGGSGFYEVRGDILLPQEMGNCVVRGTTLAEMRDEVLPQLSLDGRTQWDRMFNPAWKRGDYLSVGGEMLKGFTPPDVQVIHSILLARSIPEIRSA